MQRVSITRRRWATLLAAIVAGGLLAEPRTPALSLISVDEEIAIGRHADADVRRRLPVLADKAIVGFVKEVGQKLARAAKGPRYPYSFAVVDTRDVNAFALPGGPVWVHAGTLAVARTEAQLAGVIAHEISHIARRHAASQVTDALVTNGFLGLLGAMLGNDGAANVARATASVLAGGVFLRFSRDDELDADREGTTLASRAGWDRRGLLEFLEILARTQGHRPGDADIYFSMHPSIGDRIERLKGETGSPGKGRRTSRRFDDARRLARLHVSTR